MNVYVLYILEERHPKGSIYVCVCTCRVAGNGSGYVAQ